ncbi:MAG: hypothetical protein ABI702_07525 [Burkholderiales bacterium]
MAPTVFAAGAPLPGRLFACLLAAVILNAGAIGMVSQALPERGGVAPIADAPQRGSMVLVAPTTTPTTAPFNAPLPADTHSTQPSALTHRSDADPPRARTTTAPLDPHQPVKFYPFREVDDAAYPESDWNLDVDTLDRLGVGRLVFEVMVSERGRVVGCTVLEPADAPEDVKRDLEKRLSDTPFLPAVRAGQLVASVRRIELVVDDAPPPQTGDDATSLPAHRP